MSSPTFLGLTSPQALHSQVLQAWSASEGVFICFDCLWNPLGHLGVHRMLRVVFRVLTWLHRCSEVLKPRVFFYMVRDELALHME